MRIDAEQAAVATAFRALAGLVLAAGGSLHPGLCLHQQGSALWASIDAEALADAPDIPLIFVPEPLLIPITGLNWERQNQLEPSGGLGTLSPLQRQALEQMLALFALTGKLADIQSTMPELVLPRDSALATLLRKGHPQWATKQPSSVITTFLDTRTLSYSGSDDSPPGAPSPQMQEVLMPLIDVLNHHPGGGNYNVRQGGLRVKAKAYGNRGECFARYGYRDAMMLFLHFGYVAREPRFLQSITCEVHTEGFGRLRIRDQGYSPQKDLPSVEVQPDGLSISHLNLDADRPGHALKILSVLAGGLQIADLDRCARSALDAVHTANLEHYRSLQVLAQTAAKVPETAHISTMLAKVAQHQVALLDEIRRPLQGESMPP